MGVTTTIIFFIMMYFRWLEGLFEESGDKINDEKRDCEYIKDIERFSDRENPKKEARYNEYNKQEIPLGCLPKSNVFLQEKERFKHKDAKPNTQPDTEIIDTILVPKRVFVRRILDNDKCGNGVGGVITPQYNKVIKNVVCVRLVNNN